MKDVEHKVVEKDTADIKVHLEKYDDQFSDMIAKLNEKRKQRKLQKQQQQEKERIQQGDKEEQEGDQMKPESEPKQEQQDKPEEPLDVSNTQENVFIMQNDKTPPLEEVNISQELA